MYEETITTRKISAEEAAEALRGCIQMDYGMDKAFNKLRYRTAKAIDDYHKAAVEAERNTLILQGVSALTGLVLQMVVLKKYNWSKHSKIWNLLLTGANNSKQYKCWMTVSNIWSAIVLVLQTKKYLDAKHRV